MSFHTVSDVYAYLNQIPSFQATGKEAANFDLDRFRQFCRTIDNPQHKWEAVHVAGTNGKGSTCRLIASVYQKAGYSVGLYTSPHLSEFTERFSIDGNEISEDDLLEFFTSFEETIRSHRLTYFELSTAIAFWWFANQKVDLAVIEVGLGGQLDATNILSPAVSVITNVSLDHTDILGATVADIAWEKAGIIKPDTPVVVGNVSQKVLNVINRVAERNRAPVFKAEELHPEYQNGKYILEIKGEKQSLEPGFRAPVQAYNIAVARQVVQILDDQFSVSDQNFKAGIEHSRLLNPNPGRFEKMHDRYDWYFDGAHNLEAIRAMKAMVATLKPANESILVLSLMRDKISLELAKEVSEFNKILYHAVDAERAARFEEVKDYISKLELMPVKKQLQFALFEEFESELVIFAGSFYFYSTVREWITRFTLNR